MQTKIVERTWYYVLFNKLPFFIAAILVVMQHVPWLSVVHGMLLPRLELAVLFFWVLYLPSAFSVVACFIIGLLVDFLGAMPMGLHAVAYMLVFLTIESQRRMLLKESFLVIWLFFSLVVLAVALMNWVIVGLMAEQWIPTSLWLFQYAGGWLLYPVFQNIFIRFEMPVMQPRRPEAV